MDFTRRDFVRTAAVAGAGMLLTPPAFAEDAPAGAPPASGPPPRTVNVGFIGIGSQGRNLLQNALKIPGIQFKAICDIWPYHQKYAFNILKQYGQHVEVYTDYAEMLEKEKDLEAVIVATPDWKHAECTNACLKAGKHVYCEKEMAHNLEAAKSMVLTARETGKLLQIGHQRRSEPRYFHALHMIEADKICGRITSINGQWNRNQMLELGWPKGKELDQATLDKYGYADMDQFRNWRWYRKYSGGPMADLGSHQVDVFGWYLHSNPTSVIASGGLDYYTEEKTGKKRDWYDNVMAIYEYKTPAGPVRAFYQVLNTTSQGGFFETFMGDQGTVMISEDTTKGLMFREPAAKHREWEDQSEKVLTMDKQAMELKIGETLTPDGKKDPKGQAMLEESKKPPHQLHLENFFGAVRDPAKVKLTCPPEIAYETTVAIMNTNVAIDTRKAVDIPPEAYKV